MSNVQRVLFCIFSMPLSVVCIASPVSAQNLSNIADQYDRYQKDAAKKQGEALASAIMENQQQKAVRGQIDPIIRYMYSEDGSDGTMPPIYKTTNLANPGVYQSSTNTVYINPEKLNNSNFSRPFTSIHNMVTNANTALAHEISGHEKLTNSGVMPPPGAMTKQGYEAWQEQFADKRAEEYINTDKARFSNANEIARQMQDNAAKEGRASTVVTYDSYDKYLADSSRREKTLLDAMPTKNAPANMSYQHYSGMSVEDRRDEAEMLQNVSKIQTIGNTVATQGSKMSRSQLDMYANQVRELNTKTRNIATAINQRHQADWYADLAPDVSKINVSELQNHAVGEVGWTAAQLGADLANIPGGGMLIGTGRAANSLWQAHRVGTGQVGPEALRGTIPHVVQAWDSWKGAENFPSQNTVMMTNSSYNDGFLRNQTSGVKMAQKNISSKAPGVIGNYGFDPATDSARTLTSQMSVSHTSIGFNTPSYKAANPIPAPTPPRIRRTRP